MTLEIRLSSRGKGWDPIHVLSPPHCPKPELGFPTSYFVVPHFCVHWVEVAGDCSFCWFWWWNCWPSLFKLYFHSPFMLCNINRHANDRWRRWTMTSITSKNLEKSVVNIVLYSVVRVRVMAMVFSATYSNTSFISRLSVLFVEKTGVPGENHKPVASHWQTLSYNIVASTPHLERDSNSQR